MEKTKGGLGVEGGERINNAMTGGGAELSVDGEYCILHEEGRATGDRAGM